MTTPDTAHPVIDVHAHFVPEALLERVTGGNDFAVTVARDERGVTLTAGADVVGPVRPGMTSLPVRLKWMDARRIGTQWLAPWLDLLTWHDFDADTDRWQAAVNDAVVAAAATAPDRLLPVAYLDLGRPLESVEREMARMSGRTVAWVVSTHDNSGGSNVVPDRHRVWEAVLDSGKKVLLHPPTCGPSGSYVPKRFGNALGRLFDTSVAAVELMLSGLLTARRARNLIVVHGGAILPYQLHRVEGLYRFGLVPEPEPGAGLADLARQISYDTVGLDTDAIAYLVARYGADKVLLGSDAPFAFGHPDPVGAIEATDLTAEEKRSILGANVAGIAAPAHEKE